MNGRREVIVATAGGFAYLFAYGVTWLTAGLLSFAVSLPTAAMVYIWQVPPALAGAFLMRRFMGLPAISPANPLRRALLGLNAIPLAAMLALLPLWQKEPLWVPLAAAVIFGAHLVPIGLLLRYRVITVAGLVVVLGAVALQVFLGRGAFHFVGMACGTALIAAAYFAYQQARDFATRASD